ncbi:lactate utilization protein C [Rhodopirellula sp. MGV]|uniref:LutC/YkgG family protein n=1 Tax=Rhodopirellula sp. MGV TaxID=2023130 RepID=UPI000B95D6DC|nr:LUD domain-containing protein [Rhodopirellula sp. MGV]OYP34696.1 hypothetical protein CGZ80_13760 [Rhodopirellula sp. MGV]PNY34349.1 hypothetical protein C2E31_24295 [Rhodopirellula baltica]
MSSTSSAKRAILDRIKTQPVQGPPLPDVDPNVVIKFDDPIAKFQEMLGAVGGQAHMVQTLGDVHSTLQTLEEFADAKQIVSLVPDAVQGTVSTEAASDPLAYSNLDWSIVAGEFMVAENGAIWVNGNTLPHRVLLFIAQYLAIVVPRKQIVANMHQAYERIEDFGARFGIFVSGPSKTADIEQSLVLGAHGCRKLQVFIVDDMPSA